MNNGNQRSSNCPADFASQEYSLNVALHLSLRHGLGPMKKWRYLLYRKYELGTEHWSCGTSCRLEGTTVKDEWTDLGYVLVSRSATLNGVFVERYFTIYTDMSNNPIDLAKYYFATVKLAQANLCSGGFIVFTWSLLDYGVKKFFIRDRGDVSKLFNNDGIVLRVDPALSKELESEFSLLINRYIVGKIVEEINIRHPGKVTPDLRALMTSHCTSSSYSCNDLKNLISKYVQVSDAEGIAIQTIKSCCGIEKREVEKFNTLFGLRDFVSSFRVACEQPQLVGLQRRTRALLGKLEEEQGKKGEVSTIFKDIWYDASGWYRAKHIRCNERAFFSVRTVMTSVDLK